MTDKICQDSRIKKRLSDESHRRHTESIALMWRLCDLMVLCRSESVRETREEFALLCGNVALGQYLCFDGFD